MRAKLDCPVKIKNCRCGFAKQRKMTLENGAVTHMTNHTQPDPEQWAREHLLDKLRKSARAPGPH